ncbi:hypothetical protein [Streptomyces muensis]|uniref:Uncharacterized protein n=1 Tax=Streptomyces muensis TaxID=1077944 RepID=A0A9X1PU11_STRM4|nr:hypothetical protein [Streptomyces muensis]MCF1592505.1 hypothetical protein [Streptomyces muensis]
MTLVAPPKYEWEAATAQEAQTSLEAVTNLIDAHLKTLVPSDPFIKNDTRRNTPIKLRISLDLGPVIQAITESRQLDEQFQAGGDENPGADYDRTWQAP